MVAAQEGSPDAMAPKGYSLNHADEGIVLALDENESVQTIRICYRADQGVLSDGVSKLTVVHSLLSPD